MSHPVRLVLGARQEGDHTGPVGPVARAAAIGDVALVAVHAEVPVVGVPHDVVPEVLFGSVSWEREKSCLVRRVLKNASKELVLSVFFSCCIHHILSFRIKSCQVRPQS